MKKIFKIFTLFILVMSPIINLYSQQITYTEVDREEGRLNAYEIIGKMNGNILIYKNVREAHFIQIFDNGMMPIAKVQLEYLTDKVFNVDFLMYKEFVYLFYQYQKRNIVYCNAVKLDALGNKVGEVMELDTTDVRVAINNKMYEFLYSDDKQKMAFVKVNNKDEKQHFVTTLLFDKNLSLIEKSTFGVTMPDRSDYLTEFVLSNKGEISFLRAWGNQNDNISKISIISKVERQKQLKSHEVLSPKTAYLDDIKIKIDNLNNTIILTSFFAKKRRGDIEGIYTITVQNESDSFIAKKTVFDEDFRFNAKGDQTTRTAFNEYYIKQIIAKKDGGFIVVSQCEYTTSRGGMNNFNRWDNFGGGLNSFDYYGFGGGGMFYASPWNRWGGGSAITRYLSDNIAVMSFDPAGNMQWSNVIYKSQFDDNTDQSIGFGLFNTGNKLHFLFNNTEKRQIILTDQSITPDGQVLRNATLKNLDKGYDFLPRFAKQTGAKQIIVPCLYRSYICFAKIEF